MAQIINIPPSPNCQNRRTVKRTICWHCSNRSKISLSLLLMVFGMQCVVSGGFDLKLASLDSSLSLQTNGLEVMKKIFFLCNDVSKKCHCQPLLVETHCGRPSREYSCPSPPPLTAPGSLRMVETMCRLVC